MYGRVQEVGIYAAALEDEEIPLFANGLRPIDYGDRRSSLVGYYLPWNGGPTGYDFSGNENHLTTIGGAPVEADGREMHKLPPPPRPQLSRAQMLRGR
jgi:hypothetical protein